MLASGMARGAAKRGKRIAFGDGTKIIWDNNSEIVFRDNPNIAPPGSESDSDIEWIGFHRGNRIYNENDRENLRWIWNYDFRAVPGEVFFDNPELRFGIAASSRHFVLIEPNVPIWKTVAPNKQWPVDRYQVVANNLVANGVEVVQLNYPNAKHKLIGVRRVLTKNIRNAMAVLKRASLYIGPEGGLHHAAAALDVPAVVLFGGFIPPQVTGYDAHVNLTGGAEACGNYTPCEHCKMAMASIGVDEVMAGVHQKLQLAA